MFFVTLFFGLAFAEQHPEQEEKTTSISFEDMDISAGRANPLGKIFLENIRPRMYSLVRFRHHFLDEIDMSLEGF